MKLTLTQAYILGYGCHCCKHWEHHVVDLGACNQERLSKPTLAGEICVEIEFK